MSGFGCEVVDGGGIGSWVVGGWVCSGEGGRDKVGGDYGHVL